MSTEKSQETVNPYAAPRECTAEAEAALRRQTPFGLAEPIRAAGTLTPEELREGTRQAAGLGSKQAWKGVLLSLVCLLFLAWEAATPWPLIVVAMGVSLRAVIGLGCRWKIQGGLIDACRHHRELSFSESEVTVVSDTFRNTIPWQAFARCTLSDRMILLHFTWGGEMFVPRSFVTRVGDWEYLTALVRHKLPEKPTSRSPEPEAALPTWGDTQGALCGQGYLGYQDMLACHRAIGERARIWQAAAVVLGPLPVPLVIAAATTGIHLGDCIALFVAVLIYGWLLFLAPRQMVRKQIRRRQGLHDRMLLMVSEEGLAARTALLDNRLLWGYFAGYRSLPDHLFLFFPSRHEAVVVPRSFFAEADWPKVVELVQRKLPPI